MLLINKDYLIKLDFKIVIFDIHYLFKKYYIYKITCDTHIEFVQFICNTLSNMFYYSYLLQNVFYYYRSLK